MGSTVSTIVQAIGHEIEHSQRVANTFLRAACLLEMYHWKRPSLLCEIFPDLAGQSITRAEAGELQQVLKRFIETSSSHREVTGAVKILALSRDRSLKDFFIAQLRLHLGWRNPTVVFQLLLALEDLSESVFYTVQGRFIGSRSAHDTDTNFDVANRYLESHDRDA